MKVVILPKAIYIFNSMPFKFTAKFFTDLKRTVVNFIRTSKRLRIAKNSTVYSTRHEFYLVK